MPVGQILRLGAGGAGGADYGAKVLGYSPIAYWKLDETAGTTAVCSVNAAQSGTYVGATVGQTVTDAAGVSFVCPLFDGINNYVNLYTAALNTAFNPSEGTWAAWIRVFNVGVWTDGSTRRAATLGNALGGSNASYTLVGKDANNLLRYQYAAGNVVETINSAGRTEIAWMHVAITWSVTGDVVNTYLDGLLVGSSGTLGVWVGKLANNAAVAGDTSTAAITPWHGWVSNMAGWDSALTQPQITDLATV